MDAWEHMDLVEKRCTEYLDVIARGDVPPGCEELTLRDFQVRIFMLLGAAQIKDLISAWRLVNPRPNTEH